jgi:hypothetical protein
MRQFLSANSFAKIIKKDPKTVINWINRGWIKNSKRVGKTYQIPVEEVQTFKDSEQYPPQLAKETWQKP